MTRNIWTQEVIIEALQAWAEIYGSPPRSADWGPLTTRRKDDPVAWPSFTIVVSLFGSWNAGLRAAGLATRPATKLGEQGVSR